MRENAAARIDRTHRAFSEMVKAKLTDADRLVLGKMMSLHSKQSFDAGLRIGLGARIVGELDDDRKPGKQEMGKEKRPLGKARKASSPAGDGPVS